MNYQPTAMSSICRASNIWVRVSLSIILACLLISFFAHQVFATWAFHFVISPKLLLTKPRDSLDKIGADEAALVTVSSTDKGELVVRIPFKSGEKGYWLVECKQPLEGVEFDLRFVLGMWKDLLKYEKQSQENAMASKPPKSRPSFLEDNKAIQKTERLTALSPVQRDGKDVIEIKLTPEKAKTTYVIYDFKCIYDGTIVMDGGEWFTYDLPAFADAYLSQTKTNTGTNGISGKP